MTGWDVAEVEVCTYDDTAPRPYSNPKWREVAERERPDYLPCPIACARCSRCICAQAYQSRGGRPFRGTQTDPPATHGETA